MTTDALYSSPYLVTINLPGGGTHQVLYVHENVQNIGKMSNGSRMHEGQLQSIFSNYKYGKQANLKQVITNQYINALKSPENLLMTHCPDDATTNFIDTILNPENRDIDKILTNLHNAIGEQFQKQFDKTNMEKVMQANQMTNWSTQTGGAKALQKIFKGNLSDDLNQQAQQLMTAYQFLDNYLESIEVVMDLMKSPEADALKLILSNARNMFYGDNGSQVASYTQKWSGRKGLRYLGLFLTRELNQFEKDNQNAIINSKSLTTAINELKHPFKALRDLMTDNMRKKSKSQVEKGGPPITADDFRVENLRGSATRIFPFIQETLGVNIIATGQSNAVRIVADSVDTASGGNKTQISFTSPSGNYGSNAEERKSIQSNLVNTSSQFGKADSRYKHVLIDLKQVFGENYGQILLSIGLSVKAYKKGDIPIGGGLLNKEGFNTSISLGGGMDFIDACILLWGDSNYERYLAYNTLAHRKDLPKAYDSLKDALFTRSIVYLAAGRGLTDFSQFLFINGNILSMWDLILYVLSNKVSESSKKGRVFDTKGGFEGEFTNLTGLNNAMKHRRTMDYRMSLVDEAIGHVGMTSHIRPGKILAYAKFAQYKS